LLAGSGLSRRESAHRAASSAFAVVLGGLAFHEKTAKAIEAASSRYRRARSRGVLRSRGGSSLWLVHGPMRGRLLAIDAAVYRMEALGRTPPGCPYSRCSTRATAS
jgi:hypothetical protein